MRYKARIKKKNGQLGKFTYGFPQFYLENIYIHSKLKTGYYMVRATKREKVYITPIDYSTIAEVEN